MYLTVTTSPPKDFVVVPRCTPYVCENKNNYEVIYNIDYRLMYEYFYIKIKIPRIRIKKETCCSNENILS